MTVVRQTLGGFHSTLTNDVDFSPFYSPGRGPRLSYLIRRIGEDEDPRALEINLEHFYQMVVEHKVGGNQNKG